MLFLITFMVITYLFLLFWHLQKMELRGTRTEAPRGGGGGTAWHEEDDLCWLQRSSAESEVGGKEHLTDSVIDSLTVYFGEAIRNFPGEPYFTIQYRMIINITTSFSPSGSGSWCKFNRALADNEEPPKHIPKLPKDLGPFIKPVFTELSKGSGSLHKASVYWAIQGIWVPS